MSVFMADAWRNSVSIAWSVRSCSIVRQITSASQKPAPRAAAGF
ncbi:MAG: hypothetical protein U0835_15485 [Isosphaeraceae bacterium]